MQSVFDNLADWCASEESYAVLSQTESAEGTWQAGACTLLAKALHKLVPNGKLVGIVDTYGVQHVGLLVGDTVYDANGAHAQQAWVSDWLAYEQADARSLAHMVRLGGKHELPGPASSSDVRLVADALKNAPVENPADYWKLTRPSKRSGKKWQVLVPTSSGRGKTVTFGDASMDDYTIHKDKSRRDNYRSRHRGDHIDDPHKAGFWSWWSLWGESSNLATAHADAVKRAKRILGATVKTNPSEIILRGRRVRVEKQASKVYARTDGGWSSTPHRYGKSTDFVVVLDESEDMGSLKSRVLTDPHGTRREALAQAERSLEMLDEVDEEKAKENPAPALRRVSSGLYVTHDGMWEVSRIDYLDHSWWVFKSSTASDKLVEHLSVGHVGAEDFFPTKAVAAETLFYCLAHAEEYPSIARRLAALAKAEKVVGVIKNPKQPTVDRSRDPTVLEYARQQLISGKSKTISNAAKKTTSKLHGGENMFLGPGVTQIDAKQLESALLRELWEHASPHPYKRPDEPRQHMSNAWETARLFNLTDKDMARLSAYVPEPKKNPKQPTVEFDEHEYTIGTQWVYALTYGEDDSLTPEDEENLQRFLRRVPGYGTRKGHWQVVEEDAGFGRDPISGLGSDRATVVWMVEKPGMTDLEANLEPDELQAFEDMILSRYKIHDFPEATAEEARVAVAFREAMREVGGDWAFKAVKAVPVWHTTGENVWQDYALRRTGIMLIYEDASADAKEVFRSEAWQDLERSMGARLSAFAGWSSAVIPSPTRNPPPRR